MGIRFENATKNKARYALRIDLKLRLPGIPIAYDVFPFSDSIIGEPQMEKWRPGPGGFTIPHLRAAHIESLFSWTHGGDDGKSVMSTGRATVSWFAFSGFTGTFDPEVYGTSKPLVAHANEVREDVFEFHPGLYSVTFALVGDEIVSRPPNPNDPR